MDDSLNKNKYRVNWIDGMKINKRHFIEMEESMLHSVHRSEGRRLDPFSYGLVPNYSDDSNALDVIVSIDGMNTIEVTVNHCHAITMSGYPIEILQDISGQVNESGQKLMNHYEVKDGEEEWFVVVSVNPFARIPVGEANPTEEPPRHPFVIPDYKVDILPKSEVSTNNMGLYHVTIARIVSTDGVPLIDDSFIPPCCSVQSHADLKYSFVEMGSFMNHLESHCLRIIQKIHEKKNDSELASHVMYMSEKVLHFLNTSIPEYRSLDKYAAPINMVTRMISLSRLIKGSLDVFANTGKENLINYLIDWCDLNQGAFENVLLAMSELEYDHGDINGSLQDISDFTRLMLSLFKKLSELDYIGQKPDSNIFVKEEKVDDVGLKNRRSFFID